MTCREGSIENPTLSAIWIFLRYSGGSGTPQLITGIAANKSSVGAVSPNVWLMCMYRSTFPGPRTKLPPS